MYFGDPPDDGSYCEECGVYLEVIGPPGPTHGESCSRNWKNKQKKQEVDVSNWTEDQIDAYFKRRRS